MATISQKEWNQYIARLRQINETAVEEFRQIVIDRGGYGHIERQKLIDIAYGVTTKYGEASAALSASMYDAIAELSGVAVPAALPADTATYSEVAKTVNGIAKKTGNQDILAQGVGRLVKMAGTDTILSNAHRDRPKGKGSKKKHSGAKVAWIPSGDTCPFCLMLASKGWQNQTVWGANNHSEHIHANCDCTYAVKFNESVDYAGYDPSEYKAMYDNAEGSTRQEKLNFMQRKYREQNKDHINALKRTEYEERSRRLNYGEPKSFVRDNKLISASPVIRYENNNLFVADDIRLSNREVRQINDRITKSKEILGINEDCNIPIIVVNDPDNLAAYNPRTNELYISSRMTDKQVVIDLQKGFAAAENPNSTTVHEFIHWEDAEEYRKTIGPIESANLTSKYSVYQREKAVEMLEKEGIDLANPDEIKDISDYALRKWVENNYEEVYTEYRTKKILKGK